MLCHGRVLVEPFHLKNIVDLKVPLNRLILGTLEEVQLVDVTQDPLISSLLALPVIEINKRKKKKEKKTRGHYSALPIV